MAISIENLRLEGNILLVDVADDDNSGQPAIVKFDITGAANPSDKNTTLVYPPVSVCSEHSVIDGKVHTVTATVIAHVERSTTKDLQF